ncbi:MAG TPA: RdgB/HAM1 family non-canonical purine NTP pyrophosphatase [Candidatus Acidoferrales bacterium]|nr:RdgB/HAM1 family non-canonical purine NTP pyrophosphatase [Candidatus Acidoferrales bacterium]
MKIVLATHNRHKVEEIRNILSDLPLELSSLDNFPEIGEIDEDGETLEDNARKKARTVFEKTGILSIADDTGLEVDALGGRPGVYSARYSGENATYEANNRKLLLELKGVPFEKRGAKFRCVISIFGKGIDEIAVGEVPGKILNEVSGANGFGYDPLFQPDGYKMSYAGMDPGLKNKMSHRARALEEAKRTLTDLIRNR